MNRFAILKGPCRASTSLLRSTRIAPRLSTTTTTTTISTRSHSNNSFTRPYSTQNTDKMVSNPPPNEMVYLPGILSPARSFGVFRKVVHTGLYSQFVAMEIPVNGEIGDEKHSVDQVLLFTHGTGKAIVAGKEQTVKQGDVVIVPAGTQHQFLNVGDIPLEVVTIYSPAEHDPRTVHQTKEEGDKQEEAGEDEAPQWSQRGKAENEKAGIVRV
ncbi:RmlC-like cupin domain-containing protein [Aspergillus unguis]